MPSGLLRLILPPSGRLTPQLAERAYMAGPDLVPWHCRTRLEDGELQIERQVSDSGKFYVPYPVEGHGEVVLCSGTLMEREQPYQLLVELARGKLNQVRNQMADWQFIGLVVPAKVESALHKAMLHFSRAVTSQHDPAKAAEHAERAIVTALDAADLLVGCYAEQAIVSRQRQLSKQSLLYGANLGNQMIDPHVVGQYLRAFNAAMVPLVWKHVETGEGQHQWDASDRQVAWCEEHGLTVCGGPLVRLDQAAVPDWLYLWEGDFGNIQSFVSDYVESVVTRYHGKVQLWQCAARINVADALSLSEEEKLRLAGRAIEITRDIDRGAPMIVRFDQPWAEYMSRTDPDLSPLHFADASVRAGMQLAGIGLEINMGYYPGGSFPRDRLEFSRLLDVWSILGLPLYVVLSAPSGELREAPPRNRPAPLPRAFPGGWSPENQAAWIKHYLPLLLAKPMVRGIFWNQLSDAEPCEFPFSGLVDAAGAIKPGFSALALLRKKYLD